MFLTFLGPPTHLVGDLQYCKSSKNAIFWPHPPTSLWRNTWMVLNALLRKFPRAVVGYWTMGGPAVSSWLSFSRKFIGTVQLCAVLPNKSTQRWIRINSCQTSSYIPTFCLMTMKLLGGPAMSCLYGNFILLPKPLTTSVKNKLFFWITLKNIFIEMSLRKLPPLFECGKDS